MLGRCMESADERRAVAADHLPHHVHQVGCYDIESLSGFYDVCNIPSSLMVEEYRRVFVSRIVIYVCIVEVSLPIV